MESMGTLTIFAVILGIFGPDRACMLRRKVISTVYCVRSEAQAIAEHHAREVLKAYVARPDYEYQWRAEPETLNVNG